MLGPSPFALATPAFPFRALAALTGRAALGGPRETALATLVAARLATGAAPPAALAKPLRTRRAEQARLWLTSVALSAGVRSAVLRLIEASTSDDPRTLAAAVAKVTDVTAPHLDRAARSELEQLGARFAG